MTEEELIDNYIDNLNQDDREEMWSVIAFLEEDQKLKAGRDLLLRLFEYYNDIYNAKERGYYCSSCKSKIKKGLLKVKNRLKKYIDND